MESGVYLFDAQHHRLLPVVASDLRTLAIGRGQRSMVTKAPVQIIYVADIHRLTHTAGFQEPGLQDPRFRSRTTMWTPTHRRQRVSVRRSQGLASWFHNCDRTGLTRKLKLCAEQQVLFAQTVGYPERR